MKKTISIIAALLLVLTCCSCSLADIRGEDTTSADAGDAATIDAVDTSDAANGTFSNRDFDASYDESTATKIKLGGSDASVSGSGASYADGVVTISGEGTYIISGTLDDGHILVEAADSDKIQIVLNNASITCSDYAAIMIKKADKVFITLAPDSSNTLTDGSSYNLTSGEDNTDACIFSKSDLTFNGSGSLTVNANYKHGIVSKDDLVFTDGTYNVTSVKSGISGKDCLKIADGTFTVNSGTDSLKSTNSDDAALGYIFIKDGTFDLTSATDGIQAETSLSIEGGTFNITAGGGAANAAVRTDQQMDMGRGGFGGNSATTTTTSSTSSDDTSNKGIKAGTALAISGGTFDIDTADDGLHSNGSLGISGGNLNIASGDDGIHANTTLVISGGTIDITKSYEGIEGKNITVNDGDISLVSSDDGFNASAGKSSGSSSSMTGDSSVTLDIKGGYIKVNASGDGLDSNGNFTVSGGVTLVSGPTDSGNGALDFGEGCTGTISGGVVIAAGSVGMAESFDTSSTQYSISYTCTDTVSAGSSVALTDDSGNVIASFTPDKTYQNIIFSSPAIANGATYTVTTGGTVSGADKNGYASSGTVSGGTTQGTIAVSSICSSNGSANTMGGGMNGGGKSGGGMGGFQSGGGTAEMPTGDTGNMPSGGTGNMPSGGFGGMPGGMNSASATTA